MVSTSAPDSDALLGLHVGVVADFDAAAGLGTVAAHGTGRTWMFHCTTIADGTRKIEAGTEVAFVVRAGGPGRWEAFEVTPVEQTA